MLMVLRATPTLLVNCEGRNKEPCGGHHSVSTISRISQQVPPDVKLVQCKEQRLGKNV